MDCVSDCTRGEVGEDDDVTCVGGDTSLELLERGVSESFLIDVWATGREGVPPSLLLLGECLEPFLGGDTMREPLFGDELSLLSDGDCDFLSRGRELVLWGERDAFLGGERVLARFFGGGLSCFLGGEFSRFLGGEFPRFLGEPSLLLEGGLCCFLGEVTLAWDLRCPSPLSFLSLLRERDLRLASPLGVSSILSPISCSVCGSPLPFTDSSSFSIRFFIFCRYSRSSEFTSSAPPSEWTSPLATARVSSFINCSLTPSFASSLEGRFCSLTFSLVLLLLPSDLRFTAGWFPPLSFSASLESL